MNDQPDTPAPQKKGWSRKLYVGLGCFFVVLGVLGALLPLLPTTPFLLLASSCFVRSSPALNRRLLESRLFGPFLRDWQKHRGVRPRVKRTAIAAVVLAVGLSATFGQLSTPLLTLLLILGGIGLTVVIRLPVVRPELPTSLDTSAVPELDLESA